VFLTEEQVTLTRPNTRVVTVLPGQHRNKRGYAFQAFCNNDQLEVNALSKAVCLVNQRWYHLDHSLGKTYVGKPLPEVHEFDIKETEPEKATSQDEAPKQPDTSDDESEDNGDPDRIDHQIRHTPIYMAPTLTTTKTRQEEEEDHEGKPHKEEAKPASSAKIRNTLQHFLRRDGPPGPPDDDDPDDLGGWGAWGRHPRGPPGRGPPGGNPPGGGPPGGDDLLPVAIMGDVKTMGSLPHIFSGDRTKADNFIEEVRAYLRLNQDVAGLNSPIKKVALTLTLIKGSEVAGWVRDMGHWLDQLNPVTDNVPLVWDQFLQEFARQFQDSQREDRARIKIENIHMRFPEIDKYISQFEELARQAGYTQGNPETTQLFLKGLT